MEYRKFGATGIIVSALGFGAGPMGYLDTDQHQVEQLLNLLLDSGINLIDTAPAYHDAEEAIGKAVAHRRAEYTLSSKCGGTSVDLPGEEWSPELIAATVDRALRRLRTDHLDVMFLHTCDKSVLAKGDAVGALVRAREAGKIRFVGYSGDNEDLDYAVSLPDIDIVQTSVNFVDHANFGRLLSIEQEQRLGVLGKRPMANAAWRRPEDQKRNFRDYAQPYHERFEAMGLSLDEFDAEDWASLALRFALSVRGVHSVIPGTTSVESARKNIAAANQGPLPPDQIEKIRAAYRKAGGDSWPALS